MRNALLSALAVAALAGAAPAQNTTPIGTVQFRWRERALGVLPMVGGVQSTSLPAGAAASAANSVSNPTLATDARYHLVLECFVTNTVVGANPCRGFKFGGFNVLSDDLRTRATFAGSNAVGANPAPGVGELRNSAVSNTAAADLSLPAGATQLPGQPASLTTFGVFSPFRALSDVAGATNSTAVGVQNKSSSPFATMENIAPLLSSDPFEQGPSIDPDTEQPVPAGPYYQQYQYDGLGQWTPLFYTVLNFTDVTTLRDVDVKLTVNGVLENDSGFRSWRGLTNTAALGDVWQLSLAGTLPTFRITVPTPGAAAVLGIGGLAAIRRRR